MTREQLEKAQKLTRQIELVETVDNILSAKGYLVIETTKDRIVLYADDATMFRKIFSESLYETLVKLNDEFNRL